MTPEELEALLRRAADFVLAHPHYGDLLRTGPGSRGLGVQLRDDLLAAADDVKEEG